MNLSRFFVQTEAQGTLTPGAPLVRGNNQVGLPARRTNMPNTTKVVNIKLENLKDWFDYFDDMGMENSGAIDGSFAIALHEGSPVTFAKTGASEAEAYAIPNGFAGMRISQPASLSHSPSGYGRFVIGPDGSPVTLDYIHGVSFRVTPNEYGVEYGAASTNRIQLQPSAEVSFYFDDYFDCVISAQAQNRAQPISSGNRAVLIYPDIFGTYSAWGTLEMTIFGA